MLEAKECRTHRVHLQFHLHAAGWRYNYLGFDFALSAGETYVDSSSKQRWTYGVVDIPFGFATGLWYAPKREAYMVKTIFGPFTLAQTAHTDLRGSGLNGKILDRDAGNIQTTRYVSSNVFLLQIISFFWFPSLFSIGCIEPFIFLEVPLIPYRTL